MKKFINLFFLLCATFSTAFAVTKSSEYDNAKMLVVCNEKFQEAMEPFVLHKNELGLETKMLVTPKISIESLLDLVKDYCEDYPIDYLLLVGDTATMPNYHFIGKNLRGPADQRFNEYVTSCQFTVGRFSSDDVKEIETMVTRSILYDHMKKGQEWNKRVLSIGGCDTMRDAYMSGEVIDNLMAKRYSTMMTYAGYSTTLLIEEDTLHPMDTKNVIKAFNDGCCMATYVGHGEEKGWKTSNFLYEDAMNLTNRNMWPIVLSTACLIGNMDSTCLGEGFQRAADEDGYPTGAIACYASGSIQPIVFPCIMQQSYLNHWILGDYTTVGSLFRVATDSMLTRDQSAADTRLTWNIFGDPSQIVYPYNNQIVSPELTVGTRIKGGEYEFNAEDIIYASNNISEDANVEYHANTVVLKDGFHFKGNHFIANNAPKASSESGSNGGNGNNESGWRGSSNSNVVDILQNELTGVEDEEIHDIMLYPVPSEGEVTIDFGHIKGLKSVIAYDMNGKLVFDKQFNADVAIVDFSEFGQGVYTVRIMTEEMSSIKTVIIK